MHRYSAKITFVEENSNHSQKKEKISQHPAALGNICRTKRSESIDQVARLRQLAQLKIDAKNNKKLASSQNIGRKRSQAYISNAIPLKNKRRQTAETYLQQRVEFQEKNYTPISNLYATNSASLYDISLKFPSWDELPTGLDAKFSEEDTSRERSNETLYIDSIGFEIQVRSWIKKTSNINLKVLHENLNSPSEFTCFTTKSKTKPVQLYLHDKKNELICISSRSGNETRILLSDINEIRIGPKTKGFEACRNKVIVESQTFTIVYSDKELNLMSKYKHKVQLWVGGLIKLIPLYKGENTEFAYISKYWEMINKDIASEKDINTILLKMRINVSSKIVKKILQSNQMKRSPSTTVHGEYYIEDLIDLLNVLRIRKDMTEIFYKYSSGKDIISDIQVKAFLQKEQKEYYSKLELKDLIFPFKESETDTFLTMEAFFEFLSTNHIFNSYMKDLYQNMDRPLTDYFIFSSHNTYLEGNQLSGWSSSDMYIRVLKAGCRCVELDCWNGDNGEPIIFHGHTLTSRILFEDAVRAIKDYAFVSSDFPVILSLENHCNVEQQKRMAEIMIQYLKDNIALPEKNSKRYFLPSPNELKGKILIKGKVDKVSLTGYNCDEPEIKVRVAPELAAITYLVSSTFTNFEEFASNSNNCWKICSFVETKLESLYPSDFIDYNKRNFSRIYPKGSRTMSSNYNPEPFWNGGSQLVALNLQTMGKVVWTNEGKFKDNSGCGYILKPFYMLHDFCQTFNETIYPPPNPIRLHITVLSANQIPVTSKRLKGEVINPSVSVFIRGFKCDTKSYSTSKIKGNSFNPRWNKKFTFDINFPENAVLLFIIYTESDSLYSLITSTSVVKGKIKLAYYSLPLNCIKEGYRIMELYDDDGNKSAMGNLFCKIEIEHIESLL